MAANDDVCKAALPAPLTPPRCDLTGLDYMPLQLQPLWDSDFDALASDGEFRTGLRLWGKSWLEKPAASLPDDEMLLARKAGVSLEVWRERKAMALRGWTKCSDGRLYHPVVARLALEAWIDRIAHRKRSAAGNAARTKTEHDGAEFDALKAEAQAFLRALDPAPQECEDSHKEAKPLPQGSKTAPSRSPQGGKNTPEWRGVEGSGGKGKNPSDSKNNIFTLREGWALDEAAIEDGLAVGLTRAEVEAAGVQHAAWWEANQPAARKTRDGWTLAWRARIDDLACDPDKRAKLVRASKTKPARMVDPPPTPDTGPEWWRNAARILRAESPARWTSYWSRCTASDQPGLVFAEHASTAALIRNNGVASEAERLLGFELRADVKTGAP